MHRLTARLTCRGGGSALTYWYVCTKIDDRKRQQERDQEGPGQEKARGKKAGPPDHDAASMDPPGHLGPPRHRSNRSSVPGIHHNTDRIRGHLDPTRHPSEHFAPSRHRSNPYRAGMLHVQTKNCANTEKRQALKNCPFHVNASFVHTSYVPGVEQSTAVCMLLPDSSIKKKEDRRAKVIATSVAVEFYVCTTYKNPYRSIKRCSVIYGITRNCTIPQQQQKL